MRVFLARKAAVENVKNTDEIIFLFKNHNEEQRTFILDIPSKGGASSFEAISEDPKTF